MSDTKPVPLIRWDFGTAYDFFISLEVLHDPVKYGLRASWAAGVRSRLSTDERKTLELAHHLLHMPVSWIYSLPEPKDADNALWALRQISPEQRLQSLAFQHEMEEPIEQVLMGIAGRGRWEEKDLEALRAAYYECKGETPKTPLLIRVMDTWTNAGPFGEHYLSALQSYQQAFFLEEEKRIAPLLRQELAAAQALSERLPLPDLLEQLSQGVHLESLQDLDSLVLVPSFWISPFITLDQLGSRRGLMVFGARPARVSLVPGESVPDILLRGLKAIADPTRLRVLHLLAEEPLTPAQIARRLRLRAPTVTHHLSALRLAGLVHLTLDSHEERRYAARLEAIEAIFTSLKDYLKDVRAE
jgi:DNA-binding transcriptional ArsR family regulator